ncbi:MAG: peptidylprolyl isomerase [Bryobacterales bacterium]|nr:peptidylprolyl isomerase [Bryobacterales bacterium]
MRLQYLFPLTFSVASLFAADVTTIEEIVAKVNGDIVTRTELARSRTQLEAELRQQKLTGAQLEQALKDREGQMLRDRIDQLLLVQKAKDLNINVEAEVSKQLAEIQKRLNIADTEKFQQAVRDNLGTPFEDYKNEMRNSLLTDRVIRQEIQVNVPRADVEKYYNDHKAEFVRDERIFLGEIFLSTEGKSAAAVAQIEKKAKDLAARAKKGEKFPELARDNSDSQTAQSGGDLGGFKKGEMNPVIEKMLWDKERNYVTDPIKQPNGFLILKVMEKHQAGQASLEEVENEIQNRLFSTRFQPKIREYLTKLREEAFLEIKPGYVDAGAATGKDTKWNDPAQLKPETVTKQEVANRARMKRLLFAIPIPGTSTRPNAEAMTSTSKVVKK